MTDTSPLITLQHMAKIVNKACGQDWVRWSDEFNCFVTVRGDRYQEGTIEDVAAGILRSKSDGDSSE